MNKILYAKYIKIATLILVGATFFAGAVLVSPISTASTRQTTATASVTVTSTCSMTATVNTEHTATLVNGIYSVAYTNGNETPYANGIGKTTLQTFCNDAGGYAIYAVGYSGDTMGSTILHSGAVGSAYDIATSAYDTTNNKCENDTSSQDLSCWSMKVSAATGSYAPSIVNGFNNYSAVPSAYTKVARLSNATDSTGGIGSSVETTYAAYISNTQPAGTYTGQVKYALVHPGTGAAPESYIMQEIADWKGELLPGVEVTAVDNRDGKSYTVALMDDDSIWMTQNLDLQIGGTYNGDPIVLTSENTDLHAYQTTGGVKFTDYSYDNGLITWAPTAANTNATVTGTPAYITTDNGTTVAGWTNDNNKPYLMEGGDTYSVQGTRFNSLSACEANGTRTEAQCMHYHVGNYYNFSAAVAMSNTSSYTADKTVMPNSICPAGWRLPNGLTSDNGTTVQSDFNKLLTQYGIANGTDLTGSVNVGWAGGGFTNIGLAPLFFVRSGLVYGTTLDGFGSGGLYWSSTVSSAGYGYYLVYNSSELYPASRNDRSFGGSVRCIAR